MKAIAKRVKKRKPAGMGSQVIGAVYQCTAPHTVNASFYDPATRRYYRGQFEVGSGLRAVLTESTRRGALLTLAGDQGTVLRVCHLALLRNWIREDRCQ